MRILVVEDEEKLNALIRGILVSNGVTVDFPSSTGKFCHLGDEFSSNRIDLL
jgi:DNA-binding response OmpR family regulator